jgi:hypothetical protein
MNQLVKAFNYGLDDMVKSNKAASRAQVGEFIDANKKDDQQKDYSILPKLRLDNEV